MGLGRSAPTGGGTRLLGSSGAFAVVRCGAGAAPILLRRLRAVAGDGRVPELEPVVELQRHDDAHGTQYIDTLRARLAAHAHVAASAAEDAPRPTSPWIIPSNRRCCSPSPPQTTTLPDRRLPLGRATQHSAGNCPV